MINEYKTFDDLSSNLSNISDNARNIFLKRYSKLDKKGEPIESIENIVNRVSELISSVENEDNKPKYKDLFYKLIYSKRFIPNSPTFRGANTGLRQLAACYVLPIEDDLARIPGSIFNTLRDAALTQDSGGGTGFSFSRLRPFGDRIGKTNGISLGAVNALRMYDEALGSVNQGGRRKGGNMGVLSVDHPEIFEFIKCKAIEGGIKNFNISVAITDKFMKAVESDGDFDLINPKDLSVWNTVKANDIFNEIVKFATLNGEPGVLFIDKANEDNPVPNQYKLEATNPCGEQWLGPYENCCLGHINLAEIVEDGIVNWEKLKETIYLGVRFLDNTVDANQYVPEVPMLKEMAKRNRRIGLGILGLADMFYAMDIRYGGEKSLDLASSIMEFIRYYALEASMELAKERGAFKGIIGSIYDKENFKWNIPTPLIPYKYDWNRPYIGWQKLKNEIFEHGVRNSTQQTIAPTGTTSTVLDSEGYGCEPAFALAYVRHVHQKAVGKEDLKLTYVSPSFKKRMDSEDIPEQEKEKIINYVLENGTLKGCDFAPEKMVNTFSISSDITVEEHIMMQASLQRFIDNSISKTINFPAGSTEKDVADAYKLAYKLGCKGITVYVEGSRQQVVLETNKESKKKNANN